MSTIIVGFSKPKKWKPFAWLIMAGYGIPYSHVYIKFYSNFFERNIIYQASHTLVNFMSDSLFEEENEVVQEFDVEITDEARKELVRYAMDNAGRLYGMKEALGMAIVRFFELLGKKISNPFRDGGKTYVCCELSAHLMRKYAGIEFSGEPDELTPKDVYEIMMKLKSQ